MTPRRQFSRSNSPYQSCEAKFFAILQGSKGVVNMTQKSTFANFSARTDAEWTTSERLQSVPDKLIIPKALEHHTH